MGGGACTSFLERCDGETVFYCRAKHNRSAVTYLRSQEVTTSFSAVTFVVTLHLSCGTVASTYLDAYSLWASLQNLMCVNVRMRWWYQLFYLKLLSCCRYFWLLLSTYEQ